jgi:hypothetical protein
VIAAFYIAAWFTIFLLAVTYLTAVPDEFDNFGFSKLDIRIVRNFQACIRAACFKLFRRDVRFRAGEKTTKALRKAILTFSDTQLVTGVSIGIVGLARLCEITQYHFTTVMSLCLAASLAHSMTFSFVGHYITQNVFFRTWRAIAMIIFGALLCVTWAVTGSNNWNEVYGVPALCGYTILGQNLGPPATISLTILYWFLLRGWAYALTVLFPGLVQAKWILFVLSTTWWMARLCDVLEKG